MSICIKICENGEEKTDVCPICDRKSQLQNRPVLELCFVLVGDSSEVESANF
jgi:hypothetical protein